MRCFVFYILPVFCISILLSPCSAQDDFPVLKGAYLGQKPPGMTPEVFAPGIITTDISEGCSGWGNDMEYFIFQRWIDRKSRMYIMKQNNGVWSPPEPVPFLDKYQAGDFTIAPDGKTMVFASNIFIDELGTEGEGGNIWTVEKTETGWTEPKHIGLRINTKYHDSYPCMTANGNLYFFSRRPGGYGDSDLYMSQFVDGEYQAPVNLGPKLNTEYHEWDTYTAPDESCMIYCSTMPGGLGEDDLYVTFRKSDGSWSEPVHMGNAINTEKSENRPYVSPDGKYFFYASTKRGNRDIYWVDAKIIKELKPARQDKNPIPKGPYFGQEPPGMTPEVFAPGFISTEKRELNSVFTPDGKEFYYSIQTPGSGYKIYCTKETEDGWTVPQPVPFSSDYSDVDMCITHDGKRMYFGSTRPVNGVKQDDFKIWYVDRAGAGWSEAKYLESPINDGKRALYPTVSKQGTMFFQAIRKDIIGERDIYYSELVNGKYGEPVHLGPEINTKHGEGDVLIAPDESYMIVNSNGRPDSLGRGDLYISFKKKDGTWTELTNMGDKINTRGTEYCPMLSPDGKYFFFTSTKTGSGDIYWVDAKIIKELKPAGLHF